MIEEGDYKYEVKTTKVYHGSVVPELMVDMWVLEDMCSNIRSRDLAIKKLVKREKNGEEDVVDDDHYCFSSPWSEDFEHKHIKVNMIFYNEERLGYPEFMLKIGVNGIPTPDGRALPSFVIGFNKAYIETIPKEDARYPKYMMELRLYDGDRLVAIVRSNRDFRCKDGWNEMDFVHKEYALDNGGCLYCDNAMYRKDAETGLIYLKCTKYEGEVLETEYDGTKYPTYCKRRM